MWRYFDLNARARKALGAIYGEIHEDFEAPPSPPRRSAAAPQFDKEPKKDSRAIPEDLPATLSGPAPAASDILTRHIGVVRQLVMYVGILVGILFSAAVEQFKSNGALTLAVDLKSILISAVVALIIVPTVYEKLKVDPGSPFLVQLGLFVQQGVFWKVIIDSVG